MDKRMTRPYRVLTVGKIKKQMITLYREDLLELQNTIEDLLPSAPLAPPEANLIISGEWLEERHLPSGSSTVPDSYFVYRHWIDDKGRKRRQFIFHGTLTEYEAQRV